MQRTLRITAKVTGIAVLVCGLISGGFYVFQDQFIFQTKELQAGYVFTFNQPFEEYIIQADDGTSLNALLFKTDQASRGLILYFHGNAGNLSRWGNYAGDFTSLGYDILMVDYRGYGKSDGKPSEDKFYADALTVWKWSMDSIPHQKIIIYGRSLGAAVASSLASKVNPDILILETPFDELKNAVYPSFISYINFLPYRFHFPNTVFLPAVKCKKVIIHGTDDWVVPLASASRLKPFLTDGDVFVVIEGGSHNNLHDFEKYHTTLKEVLP